MRLGSDMRGAVDGIVGRFCSGCFVFVTVFGGLWSFDTSLCFYD